MANGGVCGLLEAGDLLHHDIQERLQVSLATANLLLEFGIVHNCSMCQVHHLLGEFLELHHCILVELGSVSLLLLLWFCLHLRFIILQGQLRLLMFWSSFCELVKTNLGNLSLANCHQLMIRAGT